ncbi:hypothetical protein OSTOST_16728 [Ostertagia ostertagi]
MSNITTNLTCRAVHRRGMTARQFRTVFDYITTNNILRDPLILVGRQPLEIRYTHLMGWIHELMHNITAISVNRYILQELIHSVLQKKHLQNLAVSAHAARMNRVLGAHQMVYFLNRRRVRVTQEDEEYRLSSQMHMPPPWPEEPESYIQTLQHGRVLADLVNGQTSAGTCPRPIAPNSSTSSPASKDNRRFQG